MNSEEKTKRFLSRVLRDHYKTVDMSLPYRFTSREFAFIYRGSHGMHRPVGFSKKSELMKFLQNKIPIHAYYSTAYYSNPRAPMKEKEWLGADLVFDLDADHLPGGDELDYPEQLKLVKKKTRLLLEDFLLDDFGFEKKHVSLNFSGHRGYHIHVRRKDVLQMSAQARREIVDYITGRGLDTSVILPTETFEVDRFQEFRKNAESPRLPPPEQGGWRKKTRELTINLLKRWSEMPEDKVLSEICEKHGVGEKTAEGLYDELYEKEKWKRVVEEGVLDVFPEDRQINVKTFEKIIDGIIEEEIIREVGSEVVGTTDEPVTGDTKRLIRLRNSIHGGSFLAVKPIDVDEFSDFDPLKDAVPECLGQKEYEITFEKEPPLEKIVIRGKTIDLEKDTKIPEYAVPFILSKYRAKLI
ncbi:MAG: DNA primase small subunit domain-containing protein [Thermoplasmatota archaeon]